jgi:hypothetical protein
VLAAVHSISAKTAINGQKGVKKGSKRGHFGGPFWGSLAKRGPKKVTFRGKTSKTPILGGSKKGSKRVDLGYLDQMCTKCTLKNTYFGVFLGVLFLGVLFLGLKNGPFSLQTWFLAPKTRIFGSILPPKPGRS